MRGRLSLSRDDKASIISSRREHFGMIIESQEFSDLMKNLFSVLWEARTPSAGPGRAGP